MNRTEIKITVEMDAANVPTAVEVEANEISVATLLIAATRLLEVLQDQIKADYGHGLSDLMSTLLYNTVCSDIVIGQENDN